jgi:16S rRNA (cytosine1402-N4)-methyltransferase
MMASSGNAAGGPARHIPVLLSQVLHSLSPRDAGTYIDGTFGAGGYTRAILGAADCAVIAIDRDETAIEGAADLLASYPDRLTLVLGSFAAMGEIVHARGIETVDGIALDVGVSSMQIDNAERGFSFMQDGPLDMRMGGNGPTAADIVNTLPEAELADMLFQLGEERRSRAIARAIVAARKVKPVERTGELAEIVIRVLGRSRDETKHPATRTFQALRLYVNGELEELARGLGAAERLLRAGGRLAVVTFHSLEDRIAKRFFASRSAEPRKGSRHLPTPETKAHDPSFRLLNRRPLSSSEEEIAQNPRARSARLRAGERTEAAAHPLDLESLGVPRSGLAV